MWSLVRRSIVAEGNGLIEEAIVITLQDPLASCHTFSRVSAIDVADGDVWNVFPDFFLCLVSREEVGSLLGPNFSPMVCFIVGYERNYPQRLPVSVVVSPSKSGWIVVF
jgi:hypothetical protein